jgi:hypothetical protein
MTNNKQQTAVDFFYDEVWACFSSNLSWSECELLNKIKEQAKEMENERMIKLIQFVVSEKELVDYSSVSNETANYYLDKFNQADKL